MTAAIALKDHPDMPWPFRRGIQQLWPVLHPASLCDLVDLLRQFQDVIQGLLFRVVRIVGAEDFREGIVFRFIDCGVILVKRIIWFVKELLGFV
ncbi:hypothetical protein A7R81_09385 [Pseudomonas aeruginosa]|nr:hypothetical protein A7R81_09385 [Pseudomonas aeruginosa]